MAENPNSNERPQRLWQQLRSALAPVLADPRTLDDASVTGLDLLDAELAADLELGLGQEMHEMGRWLGFLRSWAMAVCRKAVLLGPANLSWLVQCINARIPTGEVIRWC